MAELLPPLKPIPIKERLSVLYIEKGQLDVLDGAFVVVDKTGVRTHIPVGGVACLMLEPGTRVSHAACALAGRVGTLLVWIGEAGVRLYSAGQPGGARADRLLYQAKLALDADLRLKVVRNMYAMRFGEEPPQRRSVEQLRGIEGARVREMYKQIEATRKMGPLKQLAQMMPTAGLQLDDKMFDVTDEKLKRFKYVMDSMTDDELDNPRLIHGSRVSRIARGSGCGTEDVKALLKYHRIMQQAFKGMRGGKFNMQKLMNKMKF